MNILDSHQHFWQFNQQRDTWMTPGIMEKIRRDFSPDDLWSILQPLGVSGTVAIQVDQSEAETNFLLGISDQHEWVRGIVGWTDLRSADIREKLKQYSKEKKLVGFRHILQSEPVEIMTDDDFIFGLDQLAAYGFTYDLLIYWHQMDAAVALISQLPDLPVVLDHIGKPDIKDGRILKWSKGMEKLASMPNVYCKISGMVTEAHWQYWQPDDLLPYFNLTFDLFGPERCMYGSDWPVSTLATSYQNWLDIVRKYIQKFSYAEQEGILSGNCIRFYGLDL